MYTNNCGGLMKESLRAESTKKKKKCTIITYTTPWINYIYTINVAEDLIIKYKNKI